MKRNLLRSFQVILMALALMLMMVGQPAIAQTNPELTYGEEYYIPNLWTGYGGYLDTNSRGCEGNVLCVSTSRGPDERGYNTSTWTMVSASGKKADTPVLYNDKVYLQNGYDGSYLDTRNRGCEGNDLCVSTATTPTRGPGTGTWTIISATGKQSGTPVLANDEIYLQNGYDNSYLDTKNPGCENNYLCVSTSSTKERGPKTTHWSILYKNPPVAAKPDNGDCDQTIATNTIDFETTPDGVTTKDNLVLTDSYKDGETVVTFGFDINDDLNIDTNAILESRQDANASVVGYTSKGVADVDKTSNKQGGNWLLRAPKGNEADVTVNLFRGADFLVVYSGTPVQSASGQLWDLDYAEQYKIDALDADGNVIASQSTPGNIPNNEGPNTYDALPYDFSFSDLDKDIAVIRISGIKVGNGGGFAFDNFNATRSRVCEPEPPIEACDPNKPIPGAFSTIRIGDFDGFGFREGNGLKSASGDPINVDGKGVLSVNDFLPDFNGDGKISNRDAGDPFDNRSEAEVAGTYLTGDGFEDMGSQGSDYTDLSLGKVFGYKTSPTYGNSFPDGDPKTLPNTPGFEFRFKVAKGKLPEGTPLFFNVVFGDYDVKPIAIIFKNSQGETVKQDLTASAQGKNDGMIASAFANLDFSQVFTDGDSSGEAGYWVGYLDVDFDAPEEPYLSFDFAEIGTKQIPLTPCPES